MMPGYWPVKMAKTGMLLRWQVWVVTTKSGKVDLYLLAHGVPEVEDDGFVCPPYAGLGGLIGRLFEI